MRSVNEEKPEFAPAADPESALYDGFLDQPDRNTCATVRAAKRQDLANFHPEFHDPRLDDLLVHYKARNFDGILDEAEQAKWEAYRLERIKNRANDYIKDIQELATAGKDPYLLQELQLWYESLMPY